MIAIGAALLFSPAMPSRTSGQAGGSTAYVEKEREIMKTKPKAALTPAQKGALTLKRRAAGRKAATTRKRREAARKAAVTRAKNKR
jgi:hypothetical protein